MRLKGKESIGLLTFVAVLVVAIVVIGNRGGWNRFLKMPEPAPVATSVSSKAVDVENEGRLVSVQGQILTDHPPEDTELGLVAKNAVVLARDVEMFQWQERCIEGVCTQREGWSAEWIDSSRFSEQIGHRNPDRMPLESKRFDAEGTHIGAFQLDIDLAIAEIGFVSRPIEAAELSANLAASFSISDNQLLSGNDSRHPVVGDLRVRYREVPGGAATLDGIQKSTRLTDPSATDPAK